MKHKKRYIAQLEDVYITRQGDDTAIIEYKEKDIGIAHLKIGPEITEMSDQDILDCHNDCLQAQLESMKNYQPIAIEIPPGKPQIEYFAPGGHWTPRGDILRCVIGDGGENYETTVRIDDKELTMREFGQLLSPFTGWGMRIIFVPEEDTEQSPPIEVKDPNDKKEGSRMLPSALASKSNH